MVTPAHNNLLSINVNQYNLDDVELELIRLQYRPTNGNGAWLNIEEVPKDSLGELFEIVKWDVVDLPDGDYELRAVSNCEGNLPPGISDVISGRLEREPPALLGTPSPADGILQAADDIFIEFTELVDCSGLTSLPTAMENFVGLKYAATGQPINISISCLENKIVILPNIQNKDIENQLLRAEVRGIKDLAGNAIPDPIVWEFYVDRNPLKWVEGNIDDVKYDGQNWVTTRTIQNLGGQTEVFTLEDIPNWLQPSITTGEIAPGGTALIVFTVGVDFANGAYTGTIKLTNTMGEEPLNVDLAVLCPPPLWEVNGALYEYNMTFTVELDIEGTISDDRNDIVAAFINGEVRGIAPVQYFASIDKNLAFLNVFSDNENNDEEVTFQIWDASECVLYGTVLEIYPFTNDGLFGAPETPEVLHTQSIVLAEIPIHEGWNWISFNLNIPDKNINSVLGSLEDPTDLLIKDQTNFSIYFTAFGTWSGSLENIGYTSMYQIKGTQNDTITMLGYLIDPDTVDIPINVGWNWIGYLPQQGAHIDDALSSLSPLTGDIIKNQNSFAQYVAGVGWVGSLNYMEAPKGYLLKSSVTGILSVSDSDGSQIASAETAAIRSSIWEVNPADFEFSMTLTAIVQEDDLNKLKEGDEIAAFYNDEVRGVTNTIYIPALDAHLMFLTVYANDTDEILTFKYYDNETETISDLNETKVFIPNDNLGTVELPEIFTMTLSTSVDNLESPYYFTVQPNPFGTKTTVKFNLENLLSIDEEVTLSILDVVGKVVKTQSIDLTTSEQSIELQAVGDDGKAFSPGVYFINLKGTKGGITKKILIAK